MTEESKMLAFSDSNYLPLRDVMLCVSAKSWLLINALCEFFIATFIFRPKTGFQFYKLT